MQRFNPETFQEWKGHPLTQVFLSFLREQQETLGKTWMAGQSMPPEQQTKAQLMGELSRLEWGDYARFYGLEAE